ncbi:hypothetical protein VEx25_A0071, partial [Vibrio antiquarius]
VQDPYPYKPSHGAGQAIRSPAVNDPTDRTSYVQLLV